MKKRIALVLLALLVALPLMAGNFGIEFGDTEEDLLAKGMVVLEKRELTNITELDIETTEKDDLLDEYTVYVDKDHGVVRISGKKSYATDGRGTVVKKDFDALSKKLEKEWGKATIERKPADDRHLIYNIVDGMKYENIWDVNFWDGVKTVRLSVTTVPLKGGEMFRSTLTLEYDNRMATQAFQKHNDAMRLVKGKWYDVL